MGSSPFAGSAPSAPAPREDTTLRSWEEISNMVTAESFLPPVAPNPKPWHRVAVPAANHPRLGDRKIWKRFGLLSSSSTATTYSRALAELRSQGHGARKRARTIGFVGAWGDAAWDVARMRNAPDGKWDLVEARVSVTAARGAIEKSPVVYNTKRGSFEEERLTWVPRKRHNTRWPIEPPKKTAPMIAEMQPLVEFEVPTADLETNRSEEMIVHPVDDKKARRRSTRRLSRRISLAPIDETLDEPAATGSPVKAVPYYSSPLKSSAWKHLSPTKVSMSPAKEFTISATPSRVMLGRPDFRVSSPLKSPTKGGSLTSIAEGENELIESHVVERVQLPAATGLVPPILFDQPQPETADEPEYETRRRVSLHKARHSMRRSSGVERLLNFETHKAPNRRHSFMPQDTTTSGIKGRRHTLDIFNLGADQVTLEVTSPEDKEKETQPGSLDQPSTTTSSAVQDVAVDVDVRTNLDIFGNSPVMPSTSTKAAAPSAEKLASSPIKAKTVISPIEESASSVNSEVLGNFSIPDALGISHATHNKEAIFEQAATTTLNIHTQREENLPTTQIEATEIERLETTVSTCSTNDEHTSREIPTKSLEEVASTMSESAPEIASSVEEAETVSSPASSAIDQHEEDLVVSPAENGAVAPALTDDDSVSEADDDMSDISPDNDDISTALRVDAYDPTVAMDLDQGDITEQPNDVYMTDTTEATDESFIVTLKYDADSEVAVTVCNGEITHDSPTAEGETVLPGTPPQSQTLSKSSSETPSLHAEAILETPPAESPGFKPINGRQRSVSKSPSPVEEVVEQQEEEDDIDIGLCDPDHGLDDDVTMTVELEVEAPVEDSTRLSLHEDSETEMLRKFVTRVKADKDAKAAAAARARLRPKRRSGSTGSTTSATGSPISKMDPLTASPAQRRPLGEKDHNQSPSPSKKRRLGAVGDVEFTKENDRLGKPALDDTSPPRPKRRRKRMEVETDSVFNPDMDFTQDLTEKGAVRRSTRSRQTRLPLKPTTSSANGALSLIPVRLPGSSGMMQDFDAGPVSGLNLASRHRNEEKDLATVTRVNTRKNKGGSVPPRAVLAMQMDDPTGWKMREVKAVHDGREARATKEEGDEEGRVTRSKKGVRWAEVLVRVQGEDGAEVAVVKATTITKAEEPVIDLNPVGFTDPQVLDEPVVEEEQPAVEAPKEVEKPEKKPPVRRTRASKLQPPKAVTRASSIPARPTTPAPGAQPKSTAKTAGTAPGSMARMATRRTKVANLGMSVNGTPAPKRRTRA